jgi:hypothetical protein
MIAPVLAWQHLLEAAELAQIPVLAVPAEDVERLRPFLDLTPDAEAALARGWPIRPLQIAGVQLCPDLTELTEALQRATGWPRHCLPLSLPQPEALAWDLHDGSVPLLEPGLPPRRSPGYADLQALADDAQGWLTAAVQPSVHHVESHIGLDPEVFADLTARLVPGWTSRWPFLRVLPLPELRATLEAELRLNQRTSWFCGFAVAASPFLGWALGHIVHQEWLGVGLALLVVGGVPSLLLMQAQRRAARVQAGLKTLPYTLAPP